MTSRVARQKPTEPATRLRSRLLQRKCACGQHTIAGGECDECRKKHEGASVDGAQLLQRRSADAEPAAVPPIVYDVLRSPGQPLDTATRAFMELHPERGPRQVRVCSNTQAADSPRVE